PVTRARCPAVAGTASPSRSGTTNGPTLGIGKGLTSAQVTNALNFLNNISGEVPRRGDQKIFLPKVDWNINNRNVLTATYNHMRWVSPAGIQTQAINTRARDNCGNDGVNIDWITLRETATISNKLLNEARYQWGRDNESQVSQPPPPGEPPNSV